MTVEEETTVVEEGGDGKGDGGDESLSSKMSNARIYF